MHKPLSALGYVTLKYIWDKGKVSIDELCAFRMMTIYSLLYRGLLKYTGRYVKPTKEAPEVLSMYNGDVNIFRAKQEELSRSVARYLR